MQQKESTQNSKQIKRYRKNKNRTFLFSKTETEKIKKKPN